MNSKPLVFFLPEWYPNRLDEQLGVFVEKYARAVQPHAGVMLAYVYPSPVDAPEVHVTHSPFFQVIITYPRQSGRLRAARYYLKYFNQAVDICIKEKGVPDLVHLHMLYRNYIGCIHNDALRKIPYIITEQWSGYLNGTFQRLPWYKKRYYKMAFDKAAAVTAVSQTLVKALKEHFSISKVDIIPNIAEKSSAIIRKPVDEIRILVVADLVDSVKNISGILKAYESSQPVQKSVLRIVGEGRDAERLKQLAASLTLTPHSRIEFCGRLNNTDVLKEMMQAHFLVLNSYHETFSMVAAEALLCGIPVVATRCGGPEEFVNEKNGMLIPPGDVPELARAIRNMCNTYRQYNPATLSDSVLQRFGADAVGTRFMALYHKVLKNKNPE